MLKRISILSALVALTALFGSPVSTLAANPYQVLTKIDHCQYTGGAHGRGYLELKVKAREVGISGTTRFVVLSDLQMSSGVGFSTVSTWPKEKSSVFPNNSVNYYHVTDRRYDFRKIDDFATRIVITVKFKNAHGGLLATRTVKGSTC